MHKSEKEKQISKMIQFILTESQEKSEEIKLKAEEEFSMEKNNLVQEERFRIIKEFERKMKQVDVQKKIAQSNLINQSRLKILEAKYECVENILQIAHQKIIKLSDNKEKYKEILKELIKQGLHKIREPKVLLQCRECDLEIVKSIIDGTVKEFMKVAKMNCSVTVLEKDFLLPPPEKGSNKPSCCGGVVLNTPNGRIVCTNTLDYRLLLSFEGLLPEIRGLLFDFDQEQEN
ncbi:atpase h -transporting v1 subunit e1a-related [Anaeramoeba flamelloides]|uniref:Atpase h -transporting v1 subunit e1a-related n=1 Tax=Anaeramoeba flamelloides TaxID=1746091 RepID=A0AAV7Z3L3_9EUKA|nr:atpase h -transporting v1 subunit e1a-related [Anaeramoeba flamelloides]